MTFPFKKTFALLQAIITKHNTEHEILFISILGKITFTYFLYYVDTLLISKKDVYVAGPGWMDQIWYIVLFKYRDDLFPELTLSCVQDEVP